MSGKGCKCSEGGVLLVFIIQVGRDTSTVLFPLHLHRWGSIENITPLSHTILNPHGKNNDGIFSSIHPTSLSLCWEKKLLQPENVSGSPNRDISMGHGGKKIKGNPTSVQTATCTSSQKKRRKNDLNKLPSKTYTHRGMSSVTRSFLTCSGQSKTPPPSTMICVIRFGSGI